MQLSARKKNGFTLMGRFAPLRVNLGFTLIELMVAIAIVAILAAIGFTIYSSTQKTTRDARRVGDLKEVQKALEQYFVSNQTYPVGSTNKTPFDNSNFVTALGSYFQNNKPPLDPINDNARGLVYDYFSGGSCTPPQRYIVCAQLESCGNKCNRGALPTDGCSGVTDSITPAKYFCLGNLNL